ncbi:MAG: cysteine desulfurase-like protein [Nocardioidaceae bacterium]
MAFDVNRVRESFPAMKQGVAYFDGPGGSQVPVEVARAVGDTMISGISNQGAVTLAERRAEEVVVAGRAAVADLLGCVPSGVVFGRSMTQLTYDVARALATQWGAGDEVVVTRLDHDANIRPWVHAAKRSGATVRWADFDRDSAELPVEAVADLLGERTKLVAVTAASNLLGTRPDIPAIAEAAHAVGAIVYVDGVHLTPHAAVDVGELGADFFACSPYKFFGPHHGILAAEPSRLETIEPDKLLPSSNQVPDRFELGTLPYELIAGTVAAVDFIADLVPSRGTRRERVLASMAAAEKHEDALFERLLAALSKLPGVRLHGYPERRTPTALFSLKGSTPREVYEFLATKSVNAPASSFYAIEASRWLGLGDEGAVRAGVAPYTNDDDVDRLVAGVGELAR